MNQAVKTQGWKYHDYNKFGQKSPAAVKHDDEGQRVAKESTLNKDRSSFFNHDFSAGKIFAKMTNQNDTSKSQTGNARTSTKLTSNPTND